MPKTYISWEVVTQPGTKKEAQKFTQRRLAVRAALKYCNQYGGAREAHRAEVYELHQAPWDRDSRRTLLTTVIRDSWRNARMEPPLAIRL